MRSPELELLCSILISFIIVCLGVYYFARENRERRRHQGYSNLPPVDRSHFRWQFYRRMFGSALLVAVGVAILVGQSWMDWRQNPLLYFCLWLGVLLGLFGIVCLAGADIIGIQRYAQRQRRKLAEDRRQMIVRQLEQLRAKHELIERQLEYFRIEHSRPYVVPDDFDVERN